MKKDDVLKALTELGEKSPKRKFNQSVELLINFKGIDIKKPDQLIDLKIDMPFSTGKGEGKALLFAKTKFFIDQVRAEFSKVILEEEIPKLKKKEIADILTYDVILAEGPLMISIGKYLGQDLAPKGKMPKPVMPEADLVKKELEKMKSMVRVTNKKGKGVPMIQVLIGRENMKPEELAENIYSVYSEVERALPKKIQNIKSVMVKKTMSPIVRIG